MNDEILAAYTIATSTIEALIANAERARSALLALNANPSDREALDTLEHVAATLQTDATAAVGAIDLFTPIAERMVKPIEF